MKINCPECSRPVPVQSINISADIGKCDYCGNVFAISSIVRSAELEKFMPPPSGSSVTIQKKEDDSFEILLPVKPLGSSDIFPLFFSVVWTGFVAFWTYGAYTTGGIFAFFAIPFWIIGIMMLGNMINSLKEKHIIIIDRKGITINKDRPFNSKNLTVNYEDIYSIRISSLKTSSPFYVAQNIRYVTRSSLSGLETPSIHCGKKTFTFFEYAAEAEKEWVVDFLNKAKSRYKEEKWN